MNDDVSFRDAEASDLETILELNESGVPHVNRLSLEVLQHLCKESSYLRVAILDRRIAGFLVGLGTGANYDSVNYEYFSDALTDFLYVDRIVVASWARRRRIAWQFYEDFERFALSTGCRRICAEVNVRPRNEESLVFHERFGFVEVGQQDTTGGSKRVSLLVKELDSGRENSR